MCYHETEWFSALTMWQLSRLYFVLKLEHDRSQQRIFNSTWFKASLKTEISQFLKKVPNTMILEKKGKTKKLEI